MHVFNGLNLQTGYLFMHGREFYIKNARKQVTPDCLPASQSTHPTYHLVPSILCLISPSWHLRPTQHLSLSLSKSIPDMFLRKSGTWVLIFLVISPTIFCKSMSAPDPRWAAKKRRMSQKVRNMWVNFNSIQIY